MTHQIKNQIFKYTTKEDSIGLLNFIKKSAMNLNKKYKNWKFNIQSHWTNRIRSQGL